MVLCVVSLRVVRLREVRLSLISPFASLVCPRVVRLRVILLGRPLEQPPLVLIPRLAEDVAYFLVACA